MTLTVKLHPGFTRVSATIAQRNLPYILREKEWGKKIAYREVQIDEYWNYLTDKQQQRALSVIQKRIELIELFEQPLSLTQIAEKIKVTPERVRQLKVALMTERKKWMNLEPDKAKVTVLAAEHPNWTLERIGDEVGRSEYFVYKTLRDAGIVRISARAVSLGERQARKEWLIRMGISFGRKEIDTPASVMLSRYNHLLERYGYETENYCALSMRSATVDAHIANLERHSIDWRSNENGLSRIVCNSEAYVNSQLKILNSIGASHALDYLVLRKLTGKARAFENDKYADLRAAVVAGNMARLLGFAERNAKAGFCQPVDDNLHETASTALLEVLYACAHPERKPAVFLAIAVAAIENAIRKKLGEEKRGHNIVDFYETGRITPTGDVELRRQVAYV
jgi:hypothetical protein